MTKLSINFHSHRFRYLNDYLTIKNNNAEAYKVLGDVYEALDNNEKAFESYKKSYYIDKNQDSLLFKICEKLENLSTADTQTIKVWLDRIEKKYPNHQSVFNLKDKLQLENGNSSSRFEDAFRDLSNVRLADLTDDKCANLSCSFLNSRSSPAVLTSNHFRSLERSQDRLFKKVIEIEENFNKNTNQILEIVKENQTMFGQLKNEVDKLNTTLGKLQLGQSEIKETIEMFVNGEYDNEDDENEEDEETTDVEEINTNNENNPQNISASFLSCSSTTNQQNTSDVFSRLGPQKQTTPKQQSTSSFNQSASQPISQPLFQNSTVQQPAPQLNQSFGSLQINQQQQQASVLPPPILGTPSSSFVKSPLDQISAAISKIGLNTSTPTTATNVSASLQSTTNLTSSINKNAATDSSVPLTEVFKDQFKGKWVCDACYCTNDESAIKCCSCETPNAKIQQQQQPAPVAQAPSRPFAFNPTPSTGGFSFAQALQQISPPKQQQQQQPFSTNTISSTDNKFVFGVPSSTQNQPNQSTGFTFNSSLVFGSQQANSSATATQAQLPTTLFSPSKQPAIAQQQISPVNRPIFPPTNLGPSSFVFGNTPSTMQPNIAPVFGNIQSPSNKSNIPAPTSTIVEDKTSNRSAEEKAIADGEDEPQVDFKPVIPLPPKVDVITGEENEKVLFQHRAKLFRFLDGEWKERGLGDIKILYDEQNSRYRLLMRREQILKVCLNTPIHEKFEFQPGSNPAGNTLSFGCCDFSDEVGKAEVFALKFKAKETADHFKVEVNKIVSKLGGKVPETTTSTSTKNNDQTVTDQSAESNKYDDLEIVFVKEPKSKEGKEQAEKLKLPINFFNLDNVKPCPGCNGCNDYIPKLKYEITSEDKENTDNHEQQNSESNTENLFSSAIANAGSTKSSWVKSSEQPNWMKSALTPIFSSNLTTGGVGGSTNENDPEADLVTLDFKPVIPLPELIEVKTGEEDEEVLFSSRSKLFKFTNGEWKERGLGYFKVLRHNQTKKIRFLMRREQVHKICLNHMVDKTFKIGKRKDRETIYQWCATDFSDDAAGIPSNFNLKFKTREIGIELMNTLKTHIEGFEETVY